jgi:beta-lactamase regulating signal transducer with metallopeptidase domain
MFSWLLLHSVSALALAAVVLVLGRGLRLGPAARHALWLVVLLKLLAPPVLHWPWALPSLDALREADRAAPAPGPSRRPEVSEAEPVRVELVTVRLPAGQSLPRGDDLRVAGVREETSRERAGPGPEVVAGALWALGGVVVFAVELGRVRRLRRGLRGSPPSPGLAALVGRMSERLGVPPPRVVVVPGLASPQVWALGPARLLWPAGLEDELPEGGCRAVLAHELAHLRRRDHWVGWLLLAAGCLWWWHPLLWLVRARLRREAELACDAWVVAVLPGERRAYAEALLAVCERGVVCPAAAALGASGHRRELERRLIMVMRGNVAGRVSRAVLLGAGALALLALPAWTQGQVSSTRAVAVQPAASAAPTDEAARDREVRIRELEDKVQALLRELQELRARTGRPADPTARRPMGMIGPGAATAPAPMGAALAGPGGPTAGVSTGAALAGPGRAPAMSGLAGGPPARGVDVRMAGTGNPLARNTHTLGTPADTVVSEITLSRATYRMSDQARAEAVAKFLQETCKDWVVEAKADKTADGRGHALVVTTTPEAQGVVGQLIALLEGRSPGGPRHATPYTRQPDGNTLNRDPGR